MIENSTRGPGTPPPEDPIEGLIRIFVKGVQVWIAHNVDGRVPRAAFRRFHGAAYGEFRILPNLANELKVGVFAGASFPTWVRFSSDTEAGEDLGALAGIGIKLFDVPGTKLEDPTALTQDFLLQNNPRFFVKNLQEMYDDSNDERTFLKSHPKTKVILTEMEHHIGSLLQVPYWSCLPSCFGKGRFVKYKLEPQADDDTPPRRPDPDYLKTDLAWRLSHGPATFRFCLQFQVDPVAMPLDDATVAWSETDSAPIHVATLTLPQQDIQASGQAEYVDNLAFSPWHTLEEHKPFGDLQEARRVVYQRSATVRRWVNGVIDEEPRSCRQPPPPY